MLLYPTHPATSPAPVQGPTKTVVDWEATHFFSHGCITSVGWFLALFPGKFDIFPVAGLLVIAMLV